MSQQLHSVTKNARDIGSKKKCTGKFGDYLACWLFFNLDNREGMSKNVTLGNCLVLMQMLCCLPLLVENIHLLFDIEETI